jgi:hypothetical protein
LMTYLLNRTFKILIIWKRNQIASDASDTRKEPANQISTN